MRPFSRLAACAAFGLSALLSSCSALPRVLGDAEEALTERLEGDAVPQPGVLGLAREIDSLESYVDKYGSVVPKHADVWGQARMMMHRQEYELEMRSELGNFEETLQGSLARSDQAFLASAMSLQAAVASRRGQPSPPAPAPASAPAVVLPTESIVTSGGGVVSVGRGGVLVAGGGRRSAFRQVGTTASTASAASTGGAASGSEPAQVSADDPNSILTSADTAVIKRNDAILPSPLGFRVDKLSLEPTLFLDQKNRYLKHLQELRRINEGDDNTDAPGYALNLVRIPVSVLTGSCTKAGWGAECTVTATPHLPDDLLPSTFRNLVINDLVDLLTLPLTRVMEPKNAVADLGKLLEEYHAALDQQAAPPVESKIPDVPPPPVPPTRDEMKRRRQYDRGLKGMRAAPAAAPLSPVVAQAVVVAPAAANDEARAKKLDEIRVKIQQTVGGNAPTSRRRVAALPLAPSQLVEVLDPELLAHVILPIHQQIRDHFDAAKQPYHLDVHNALEEELKAAYKFLSEPTAAHLWKFGGPDLARAVRSLNRYGLIQRRDDFVEAASDLHGPDEKRKPEEKLSHTITVALAWSILVESALLNERLLDDMKATHAAKGCPCVPEGGAAFYLPEPAPEARKLFNEYVRCRWPLYVFAIDPNTEDQNIADSFSQRREMQLAMSLAFTSGRIGARTMTRYMRRIETDMQTIALNRTVVGFSHGEDTFGWRFYPRFQTPPVPSNPEAFFELLWGGKSLDHDLCHRRLENGPRECVALVVMPSFVPYVNLDFHSNWFKLSHPSCKALTNAQAMRLSHRVQALRGRGPDECDEGRYRPGDRSLLVNRVEQLSARLPLQHQQVNVPYENTLGGFEMFSTGTSDLAPELIGWYGGAGINPEGETSLFLVGDNFSVHQTRVVVGGVALNASIQENTAGANVKILEVELLSRQIIRVNIRAGALPPTGPIDVHVGTPYGVSNHLSIPVVSAKPPTPPSPPGYKVADGQATAKLKYCFVPSPDCKSYQPALVDAPEGKFKIDWDIATGNTLRAAEAQFKFKVGEAVIDLRVPVTACEGSFELADTDRAKLMTLFANMLLKGLGDLRRFGPPDKPLPPALEGEVTIYPVSPCCPALPALPHPAPNVLPVMPHAVQTTAAPPTPPEGVVLPAIKLCPPTHDAKPTAVTGKVKVEFQEVQRLAPMKP